ncbi:MAG: molybdopterin-dependent oxidoreductase [Candidatus Nanohaloarchaea archaeon]
MPRGPPTAAVDWALLVTVLFQAATGVWTIFAGAMGSAWVFWVHGIGGLVLVGLVGFKLWRVRHRLRPGAWRWEMAYSVGAAVVVLVALGTGIAWASGWRPWVGGFTLLTIHAFLGLVLVIPLVLHLRHRFHSPRDVGFQDRRTALQFGLLVGVSAVAWRVQRWVTRVVDLHGRFTGSYEVASFEGNAFPTTSWVADDPEPIDPGEWRLLVDGAVEREMELDYEELVVDAGAEKEEEAILDCTSGWYSAQRWRGVDVGSLLERVEPEQGAGWVVFHSVTGYRWSLPIREARDVLLATHVSGERLSHGHGFPLRLVAPGRRGFQWVKWVERVAVRRGPDYGQWVAIFTSWMG